MATPGQLFIFKNDLSIQTLTDIVRPQAMADISRPPKVADPADPNLPLSKSGTLEAGVGYPAADDSGRSFALPFYTLHETGGRYATSLKWLDTTDGGGPIARLTIALRRTLPAVVAIEPMPHEVTAKLVYTMRVEGAAEAGETVMSIPLGAVNVIDDFTSQIVLDVHTKSEFDRLWVAMTSPAAKARLELRCFATIGRRTWRQVLPDRIDMIDRTDLLVDNGLNITQFIKPKLPRKPLRPGQVRPFPVRPQPVRPFRPDVVIRDLITPGTEVAPAIRRARPSPSAIAAGRFGVDLAVRPGLFVSPVTELKPAKPFVVIDKFILPPAEQADPGEFIYVAHKPAVPNIAMIDLLGRPVLIRIPAECVQTVPFSFDVGLNAYMFDVPGDLRPSMTHVLLRGELDAGDGRPPIVYYQDTAFPDLCYYEPQEFRVPRKDEAPFLPAISIAFFDVALGDETQGGGVNYRAHMAFRATPYLDRTQLTRLRQHLGAGVELSALVPEDSVLRLRLPNDAGTSFSDVERPEASISLDDGIIDEVPLTPDALAAVITGLQTGGITGEVIASLPGNRTTSIPIRLSLHDAGGILADRTFRGAVSEGRVRVTLRNRIESPMRINEFLATRVENGMAFPEANPGLQIAPGAFADIDYRIEPPNLVVTDIDPLIRVSIEPDMPALLPSIMVNRGYAADTFPLSVSVDPVYFGQVMPGDAAPLTGLLVEFSGDASVVLDAADPDEDVKVRLPILEWLLKRPNGERYEYRVTNLTGGQDAARAGVGQWIEGVGAGALAVFPVGG